MLTDSGVCVVEVKESNTIKNDFRLPLKPLVEANIRQRKCDMKVNSLGVLLLSLCQYVSSHTLSMEVYCERTNQL